MTSGEYVRSKQIGSDAHPVATGDMKDWTIGKRVAVGFASAIAVTVALGCFAYFHLKNINAAYGIVSKDSIPGTALITKAATAAVQSRLTTYKFILSTDQADQAQLEQQLAEQRKAINSLLKEYEALVATDENKGLLQAVHACQEEYSGALDRILKLRRQTTDSGVIYLKARSDLDPVGLKYAGAFQALIDFEKQDADKATAEIASTILHADEGIALGLVAAIVVASVVGVLITRGTNRILTSVATSLNEGAVYVSEAAAQVSMSSHAVANGASSQAAALEQTSSALIEVSSMIHNNTGHAQDANALAKAAREAADQGSTEMLAMSSAMDAIRNASDDIAKIIKAIDDIAFQTNILALNAAVEAARAGEAGAGFGVVADEVRNLAQRSASAARETAGKIESAISKTAQGVQISANVVQRLNEIVGKVHRLGELVAQVAEATKDQNQGISQINVAVTQMDQVTQTNAASAEESASAAAELSAQASSMRDTVRDLLSLVGGSATTTPRLSGKLHATPQGV